MAQALGVSPSTVGGWESGRDPSGEVREQYAYFLEAARAKLAAAAEAPAGHPEVDGPAEAEPSVGADDVDVLAAPEPCVLCGQPARHQVAGYPQHLDPAECGTAEPAQPTKPAAREKPRQPATAGRQGRAARGVTVVPVGRRVQAASDTPDLIGSAVAAALEEHAGDVEAATAALVKRAIPD
ncbi:helix-turn-helix transcriptional regulator, partial [Streptomyces sp. NPDC006476]|uniref:helix-turn-helix transcriptional regulator n=1 Tax=Streptomyces sp. NPDC006476 TaxID=3157175 RepID=UPI0033BA6107